MKPGTKYDAGKSRPALIPAICLLAIGRVLAYGASKYAVDNWQRVPDARRRYSDALLRHFYAWQSGEAIDPESGFPHLAHAATNALFLLYFELTGSWPAEEETNVG